MKTKFQPQVRKLRSTFSVSVLFGLLMFCSMPSVNAQLERIYEAELAVTEGVKIRSNVPSRFNYEMTGSMSWDNTNTEHILNGKNGDKRLIVNKVFNIDTWEKSLIKQVVKVAVDADSPEIARALLDELKIELNLNADGSVSVDCNMNFYKFEMKNGLFSSDNCQVILDNGKIFKVNRFAIEAGLTIPKFANLSVKGYRHCTIYLGDLDGTLNLNLEYTEVYGKSLKQLKANLSKCFNVFFEEIERAEISAANSFVKIGNAGFVEIGKEVVGTGKIQGTSFSLMPAHDFQNVFNINSVEQVTIVKSSNDEFNFGTVKNCKVNQATFSKLGINSLSETLIISAKNTDINVFQVSREFKEINITNTLSDITLNVEADANYHLSIPVKNYMEYQLNRNFIGVESANDTEKSFKVGTGKGDGLIYLNCDKCKFKIH